jgi:predicted Fe-S protein YdhL (DUF1289 family)
MTEPLSYGWSNDKDRQVHHVYCDIRDCGGYPTRRIPPHFPVVEKPVASPCIHVCKLQGDVCIGCGRTTKDLTEWVRYTNEQRLKAIEEGIERLEKIYG